MSSTVALLEGVLLPEAIISALRVVAIDPFLPTPPPLSCRLDPRPPPFSPHSNCSLYSGPPDSLLLLLECSTLYTQSSHTSSSTVEGKERSGLSILFLPCELRAGASCQERRLARARL